MASYSSKLERCSYGLSKTLVWWASLTASCIIPRETGRKVSQNDAGGVGYLPWREESYTLSYTGKYQVLFAFSLPGVGNVGLFQKLFFEGRGVV